MTKFVTIAILLVKPVMIGLPIANVFHVILENFYRVIYVLLIALVGLMVKIISNFKNFIRKYRQ